MSPKIPDSDSSTAPSSTRPAQKDDPELLRLTDQSYRTPETLRIAERSLARTGGGTGLRGTSMTFNRKQQKVMFASVVVFILMGLCPPWTYTLHAQSVSRERPAGYALMFAPPAPEVAAPAYGVRLDVARLVLQWFLLIVATGAALIAVKDGISAVKAATTSDSHPSTAPRSPQAHLSTEPEVVKPHFTLPSTSPRYLKPEWRAAIEKQLAEEKVKPRWRRS